jgi:carboxypeptidase PM20D1
MRLFVFGVGVLILLATAIVAWMQKTQDFDPPPRIPPHFRSPVVALELVRSADEVRAVLCDPMGLKNRRIMRGQIQADWPFIVTYGLILVGLGLVLARCGWPGARVLAALAVVTATGAALADGFEDLGILLVLDTGPDCLSDAMARTIRTPSLVKWGLLATVAAALAPLFLSYRRGPVLPGILSAFSGLAFLAAAGLGAVGFAWNPAIEWSALALALGLFTAMFVFLFAPGAFLEGVGAAASRASRSGRSFLGLFLVLGAGLLVLTAIVLVRTLSIRSRPLAVPPAARVAVDPEEAAQHLLGAVRIATVSHPQPTPAEDSELARLRAYLRTTYSRVHDGLNWEEPDGNLLLTWEGSDPALPPLLLLAHLDVVPAVGESTSRARGDWDQRAFGADLDQTRPYIYGRGTLDDKVSVVGILEAADRLMGEGFRPRRTVMMAFGRDEEVGGNNGARKLARLLDDRGVKPLCILDEGSFVLDGMVPGLTGPIAPVGVAEKGYVDLALSVEVAGGHASMPPAHTAIGILARAITRLENNPLPARIDGVTRQTLRDLSPALPFGPRLLFANDWLFGGLLERALSSTPTTNALIRTTSAVTLVRGGTKDNVLPDSALAVVNFRPLPGDTAGSLLGHARRVIADPRVKVAFADPKEFAEVFEASRVSPSDTPAFETIGTTIRQTFPGTLVVPYLVIGGTDARHYERLSPNIYRFLPLRLGPQDLERIHGIDERISCNSFVDAIRFYYIIIKNIDVIK